MTKRDYKIGDKVKVVGNSDPKHHFNDGQIVEVIGLEGGPGGAYGDVELIGPVTWSDEPRAQYLSVRDIEPATPTHTLTPGQTYTMASGRKMRVIHIEGGKAFGVFLDCKGIASLNSAYTWDMDGTYQNAVESDRAPYNIVFEPVRETVQFALKQEHAGKIHYAALRYDIVDGTPDWSTAKVTPCA